MRKVEDLQQDLDFPAGDDELNMAVPAPGTGGVAENPTNFAAMIDDNQVDMGTINTKDLWLDVDDDNTNRNQGSLLDDASIFDTDFPTLTNFPCMSSSSSCPSTPTASKQPTATSSYSTDGSSSQTASWTMMNSEGTPQHFENGGGGESVKFASPFPSTAAVEIPPPPPPPAGHDGIDDVMESLQYIDLIDCNEMWDPSSIFQTENPPDFLEDHQRAAAIAEAVPPPAVAAEMCHQIPFEEENNGFASFLQGNKELSLIFFEWLKQNKHHISADDMRSIKLKRSTIESATKRLGDNIEGKIKLLKLILQWVEQHQLQKKRALSQNPNPSPNFMYNTMSPDTNACFSPVASPWPTAQAYPTGGYCNDPYLGPYPSPMTSQAMNGMPFLNQAEYQGMENATQPWAMTMPMVQQQQFNHCSDTGNVMNYQSAVYGNPFKMYAPNGEMLVRLCPAATKEARKKRMARQRKLKSQRNRPTSNSNQNSRSRVSAGARGVGGDEDEDGSVGGGWDFLGGGGGETASDRRQKQVWKTDNNLKFLLQKVLKQSDVGSLGRIVLPKREAEGHLPDLKSRDGIIIPMEDIGTSRIWNLRYRFWPNNKSRMYLLENTGDFVKMNELQEGDFIVLYLDTKCGKYMIRGVKVREPDNNTEGTRGTKRNVSNLSPAGNSSSPAPIKKVAI